MFHIWGLWKTATDKDDKVGGCWGDIGDVDRIGRHSLSQVCLSWTKLVGNLVWPKKKYSYTNVVYFESIYNFLTLIYNNRSINKKVPIKSMK